MAATPSGQGYWLVGADGGVFAFGDAPFKGSLPAQNITPNRPVVGIAVTPSGQGYWLVGADGGIFAYGDAPFKGSLPAQNITPNRPVVGIAATPSGQGYWLVGADGGIFAYGDAGFKGSLPAQKITPNKPIVGIAATPSGQGYWLVGADGGIFAYGDAPFKGTPLNVGETFAALPVSGTVLVKERESARFTPLDDPRQLPIGATIDADEGTLSLRSAEDDRGGTQTTDLAGGVFVVRQKRAQRPVTELVLSGFDRRTSCRQGTRAAPLADASRRRRRQGVFGRGKGRFRTRSKDGSATVRGTAWYTEETCKGTRFSVAEGSVLVRDFGLRRRVIVRAGQSYLARSRR